MGVKNIKCGFVLQENLYNISQEDTGSIALAPESQSVRSQCYVPRISVASLLPARIDPAIFMYSSSSPIVIPFRFQRITRRQRGGSAGVYENTLRKPTMQPTKLAKESEVVSRY